MKRIAANTTFLDAIELFDRANMAGLIPDGRSNGTFGMKSKMRRNQIISHARNALRLAADRDDVDDLVITPYLEVLTEIAKQYGNSRDGESGNTAASDVRCFLRTVEGREYRTKRRVLRESFLPAWTRLAEALMGPANGPSVDRPPGETPDRWRRYAGWLARLQDVLLLNGHHSPSAIPDYSTALQWCRQAGHSETQAGSLFCAYRKARELTKAFELPPLDVAPREEHRGIRSLHDLKMRMAAGAAELVANNQPLPASWVPGRHPADMPVLDILDLVAPQFSWGARTYLTWAHGEGLKSPDWISCVEHTASVVVAELVRLGEDVTTLDWMDLYKERRTTSRLMKTVVPGGSKRAAPAGMVESVSLLRKLVDSASPDSFARSPLTLQPEQASSSVPLYTPALVSNVAAVWAVVSFVYGTGLGFASAAEYVEEWRDIEREHDRLVVHMKSYNRSRHVGGQKNKDLMLLTWGHAVCVGLFYLWRKAQERRTEWYLAFERSRTTDSPQASPNHNAVESARRAYARTLREYVFAAIVLDDGLRIKNYANARIGVNVHVVGKKDSSTGLWETVDSVTMTFRGYDKLAGTKKKRQLSTGAEGKRTRQLTKSIVDHELIKDYLNEARLDDLTRARLIGSRDDYVGMSDEFALFVSKSPGARKRAYGGLSESFLSKRFGRFVHFVCRDLLNLPDDEGKPIPTWKELTQKSSTGVELRKKWRALFGAHICRQLIATYFGGLMGNWVEASARTHDTVAVLQSIYLNHQALVNRLNARTGIERADWFLPLCRRLIAGEEIDWGTFDPQRPNEAQPLVQPAALLPPRWRRHTRRPR